MNGYDVMFQVNRVGPEVKKAYGLCTPPRIPGDDAGYCDWPARVQYDIDAGMDPEASLAKHLYGPGELYDSLGIAKPFPPAPSRDEACTVRHHFQGLTLQSKKYGALPWFTAALSAMDAVGELEATLGQLVAAGDTHCQIDLAFNYGEDGQPWGTPQLVPDRDLRNDLPTYVRICDAVIAAHLKPIFVMPCEGQPGLQWLYGELQRVVMALRSGYDRLAYGPLWLAYDGTWPAAWSVADMKKVLPFCRQILGPNAYLGMMFARGPAGNQYFYVEDEGDYSKPWMQALDIIMSSGGPDQLECPSLVNGAQYMLGPALTPHDTCTPAWKGPYLLGPGTPRGPYFWGWVEWNEYEWVRGRVSAEKIEADRQRAKSIGMQLSG